MENLLEAEALNSPAEISLHEARPRDQQNNDEERETHIDRGLVENHRAEDEVDLNIFKNEGGIINIEKDDCVKEIDTGDDSNLEMQEETTSIGDPEKTKMPEMMMHSSRILHDENEESLESDYESDRKISEVGKGGNSYLKREKECLSYSEMETKGKNESTVNSICERNPEGEYVDDAIENTYHTHIRSEDFVSHKGAEKYALENIIDENTKDFEKENASIFERGRDSEDFEMGEECGSGENRNDGLNSEGKVNNVIREHSILSVDNMTSSEHTGVKENEDCCALGNREECIEMEKEPANKSEIAVKETNTDVEKKSNLEMEAGMTSHEIDKDDSEERDEGDVSKRKKEVRTEQEAYMLETKDANSHESGVNFAIQQECKLLTEQAQKGTQDQPGEEEARTKDTKEHTDRESLEDREKTVNLHKSTVNVDEGERHVQSPEVVAVEDVRDMDEVMVKDMDEVTQEEKKKIDEIAEGKAKEMEAEMTSQQEKEMEAEMTSQQEKEMEAEMSRLDKMEQGETKGMGLQKEMEKSEGNEILSDKTEELKNQVFKYELRNERKERATEECEVNKSVQEEETQQAVDGNVSQSVKVGVAVDSQKQDKQEGREISKGIDHVNEEENTCSRSECKTDKEQYKDISQSYLVKESHKQTREDKLLIKQKETNKNVSEVTVPKIMQNQTSEDQVVEKNVNQSNKLNATEDSLDQTGKLQPKADKVVSEMVSRSDEPDLEEASPSPLEQNGSEASLIKESNSSRSNEERDGMIQEGEVQLNSTRSQATEKSGNLEESECIPLEVHHIQSSQLMTGSSSKTTAGTGQNGGRTSNSKEMKDRDACCATPTGEKEKMTQYDGDAVCSISKTPLGQKSTARKLTSKMKPKTLRGPKDQALNNASTVKGEGRGEQEQRRGDEVAPPPECLHNKASSHLERPFADRAPKDIMQGQRNVSSAEMPEIVHVDMPNSLEYAGHLKTVEKSAVTAERHVTSRQPSTAVLQVRQQVEGTDDSDIEILSETIRSPMNVARSREVSSIVCDVCQILWNDNVLEAIFEGTKCVTVNSKITYGAIMCFNVYARTHYLQHKEQAVRNVLERADLGKNIGNLKITQVMNWLSNLMRCGSVKCCDVFDAVYSPENANTILAALMNADHSSKGSIRQQSTHRPVNETPMRKSSNSCRENCRTIALSEAIMPTSLIANHAASKTKSTNKAMKSKHTQANITDSSASSGVVVKNCQASLKKSLLCHDRTTHHRSLVSSSEKPVTHKESVLKECSVYLGKRMQMPQQRTCLQLCSSSPATLKVTKRLLGQEVDKELLPRKKGRDTRHTLSAKQSTDTEGSSNSGDENEAAEQTASKHSTAVVHKLYVDKDGCEESTEDGMSASGDNTDTSEDEISTVMPSADRAETRAPKQVTNKKSMIESEESTAGSDKNTSEKDLVRVEGTNKIKLKGHGKRFLRPDKKNIQPSSRSEKTEEISIEDKGNQTDVMKQEALANELFRKSSSKQKKRPAVDSITQSTKKQRVSSESWSASPEDQESSEFLLEATEGESPVSHRKTRSELKCLGSTNLRDSESSVSPSLEEDMSSSLSDGPPQSCESCHDSDGKASGERLVSPRGRTRRSSVPSEEKLLKFPRALRTRSHRAAGAKMVSSSETSSDSNDQQVMHAGGSALQPRTCMDYILGIFTENTEESKNMLIQKLGLNINATNLYCNVTDTKIFTNGDMVINSPERGRSTPALQVMLKERSNLDGVAREAFDLLPFEPNNFLVTDNNSNKERFLTNQELLVLQNICVLNPENPDVDMFYQILIQVLLARRRVLLVPNSLSLLLVAEKVRKEFNRVKRKGNYILYLAQDWDISKIYTAEDFWLAEKKPPKVPTVRTVLSMFCLWKNLEKRFPISFPIALEELCRNIVLWDVDKIGMCVKHYSKYCTFLYEEKNPNLTEFFLNQQFIGSKTQSERSKLLNSMTEHFKETSGNSKSRQSLNVTENDVQVLLKKCLEAEQVVLHSPGLKEEENFRKCVQALKCRIDAYKKEIQLIQKVTKETEKKKFQLLSRFNSPRFEELTRELSKTIETLYRMLAKRTSRFELIREAECMSAKETNRVLMPPLVLKGVDLGEDVSEGMKELVYELLVNEVKIEEVRPALCTIVENLIEKDLSVVPSDSWIRNFARVIGLKVRTCNSFLYR